MSRGRFEPTVSLRRPVFAASIAVAALWSLILGPAAVAMGWLR